MRVNLCVEKSIFFLLWLQFLNGLSTLNYHFLSDAQPPRFEWGGFVRRLTRPTCFFLLFFEVCFIGRLPSGMHSINEAMRAVHTTATFIIFVYFGFSLSREETETHSWVAFRGWKSGREEQQLLILSPYLHWLFNLSTTWRKCLCGIDKMHKIVTRDHVAARYLRIRELESENNTKSFTKKKERCRPFLHNNTHKKCVYCYELPWGLQSVCGRDDQSETLFCYFIKAKLKRPLDGARFFFPSSQILTSLPFSLELCRAFPPARSSPFCQSRFLRRSKRTCCFRCPALLFLLHTPRRMEAPTCCRVIVFLVHVVWFGDRFFYLVDYFMTRSTLIQLQWYVSSILNVFSLLCFNCYYYFVGITTLLLCIIQMLLIE